MKGSKPTCYGGYRQRLVLPEHWIRRVWFRRAATHKGSSISPCPRRHRSQRRPRIPLPDAILDSPAKALKLQCHTYHNITVDASAAAGAATVPSYLSTLAGIRYYSAASYRTACGKYMIQLILLARTISISPRHVNEAVVRICL